MYQRTLVHVKMIFFPLPKAKLLKTLGISSNQQKNSSSKLARNINFSFYGKKTRKSLQTRERMSIFLYEAPRTLLHSDQESRHANE